MESLKKEKLVVEQIMVIGIFNLAQWKSPCLSSASSQYQKKRKTKKKTSDDSEGV
jgi:hypothetical protein